MPSGIACQGGLQNYYSLNVAKFPASGQNVFFVKDVFLRADVGRGHQKQVSLGRAHLRAIPARMRRTRDYFCKNHCLGQRSREHSYR
eukprot:6206131-Pleurochrysis_carterae.AAC.1